MPAPFTGTTEQAQNALENYLKPLASVVVCYSGGIDSALVLAIAHQQLGDSALGITAVSPSLPPSEKFGAAQTAEAIGAQHLFIESNELARPGYVKNGPDRCFHCKTELYTLTAAEAKRRGIAHVLNGTNADDFGDYRPGLSAASDAGVRSPLAELGLGKEQVRGIAKNIGLQIWNKPASACLSSRIPYGTKVTPERLTQIDNLEQSLKALGLSQVRVRWHDTIARIEVPAEDLPRCCQLELRQKILAAGKDAGFAYVTLDLAGYRQGSHNEVLAGRKLRVVS